MPLKGIKSGLRLPKLKKIVKKEVTVEVPSEGNGTEIPEGLIYWLEEGSSKYGRADLISDINLNNLNNKIYSSFNNNSYYRFTNTPINFGDSDFTIGCWVSFNNLSTFPQGILSRMAFGTNTKQIFFGLNVVNGVAKIQLILCDENTTEQFCDSVYYTYNYQSNIWYFILAYYEKLTQKISLTLNNLSATDFTTSFNQANSTTTAKTTIGNSGFGEGTGYPFNGKLWQLFMYNRLLTEIEKTELYNNGDGILFNNLIGIE